MAHAYLYVVVFVSGAAVLALEILGTRILGPFYGVSLFLWSALITVTLLALSVGYALGGRWADRSPNVGRLYALLASAGLWCLLIPFIKQPVLLLTEPLGLRVAVLVAALLLFAPPLTLLGMVSPYAIRVRARSLQVVGRTAGDLYAVSTVGSVLSALLTGFILVPQVGVARLTFGVGVGLLLVAAFGLALARRSAVTGTAVTGAAVLALFGVTHLPFERAQPEHGLLAVRQSPYAEIRVVDLQRRRHLLIDGAIHTIVDRQSGAPRFPYVAVMDVTRHFFAQPGRLLLVGLGGGSVFMNFARAGWQVEAVEIDPVVVEVAQQYFYFDPSLGPVHVLDGRQFLTQTDEQFDLILLDAFGSSSIPFHLVTREVFALVATRLAPNGLLGINLEADGWHDTIVRGLTATLKTRFRYVLALPTFDDPGDFGNMVLLASDRPLEPLASLEKPHELASRQSAAYRRWFAWENRFVPEWQDRPPLTDDLNPVDTWSERINLTGRRDLHRYFGRVGLDW